MKQLTTLKLFGFFTLSITAAFPAFTMEKDANNDNKNQHSRKFMNYNKLLALSEKNNNSNKQRPHKVSCYKLYEEACYKLYEEEQLCSTEEEQLCATGNIQSTSYLCVHGINRQRLNGTLAQLTKYASSNIFSISRIMKYPVTNKHLIRQGDKKTFNELLEIGKHAKQAWRVIKKGFGMRNLAPVNNFTIHKEFSLTNKEFNNPENWIE